MHDTKREEMISKRLKDILQARNISLVEFADMCKLPMETVRSIYYGKASDPKLSTVVRMADALNVTVNCLLGQCAHSPTERTLLQNYRMCGQRGRSMIELIARYEAGAVKYERNSQGKHTVPCVLPKGEIRKGIVIDLCETSEVQTHIENAFIAVKMPDNDMAPIFWKGDIILFEDRFPEKGEIAAFFKGNKALIRRFYETEEEYRLKGLHPNEEDIVLRRLDGIDYVGTCIDVIRS